MSRAGVPWTWACRADSATVQWGGRKREVGTGPQGRRDAAGTLVRGIREVQRCPPPHGDRRRPAIPQARYTSLPGGRGCGECRAPHPRTHSPRACSVRPWELPAESRAALAPSRPAARKVGGDRAREWGARRLPVALGRPGPLPRLCSAPDSSLASRFRDWERRRACHPPLPEARSEAGWPEAWWCGRLPGGPAGCALATRADPVQRAHWVEGGV